MIDYFLSGVIASFTPMSFLAGVLSILVFMKLKSNHKIHFILLFSLLIILSFPLLSSFLLFFGFGSYHSYLEVIPFILILIGFLLVFWLFGYFNFFLPKNKTTVFTNILIVSWTALIYSFAAISSTLPVIGSILILSLDRGSMMGHFPPLIGFATGCVFPIILILCLIYFVFSKKISKPEVLDLE